MILNALDPRDYQEAEEEAIQKEKAWFHKLASDPAFYDEQMKDPAIEAAEKYHPMPQLVKSSVAAQAWLSSQLGEDLSGPAYDAARDAYSNQYFGKAATTDQEFWQQIQDDYKLADERDAALQELHQKVIKKSVEDALKGEPTNIASIFSPWHEKHMDIMKKNGFDQQDFLSSGMAVAQQTRADIEKFREPTARVYDIMAKTEGNPSDEDINKMSSELASLNYEDRQTIYRYAQTASQLAEPGKPLNPLSIIASNAWKALERSGAEIYGATFKPAIQGTMPLDQIERAAIKIRDNLIKNGGTPEEIAVQQQRINQVAVARELKDLGQNGIDPIKPVAADAGWLSWGRAEQGLYMAAGSAPYIASAVLGGAGLALGGVAIYDAEYNRIRLQNPDIDPDAARLVAMTSSAAQTALMKVRADIMLLKFPVTKRLMESFLPKVGTHGVTRFAGTAAAVGLTGTAAAMAQGGVSQLLPAVVSAFREDMPDVDMGQAFGDWINTTPEVFWMNVPIALIGGGIGSWRDFKNPQATINPKTLGYAGFSEKQQTRILNSPEVMADAVIKEEFAKRSQTNIDKGIKAAKSDLAAAHAYNGAPDTPTVEYAPKADGTDLWYVKDPEGKLIISTENIDTAIAAVTDFHQQILAGEENQAQRGKAEGIFTIAQPIAAGGFTTAKGSTYEVSGSTTRRNKSPHEGHKVSDVGLKEPSELTVYVTDEQAREFGMHQSLSPKRKGIAIIGDEARAVSWNEKRGDWGADSKPFKFSTTPEVGKAPLELWKPEDAKGGKIYSNWHPGNRITEIRAQIQPEAETLQQFVEQQQQTGFRQLDTLLEKIQRDPALRERAVEKARDLMADISLRNTKLQQLAIAKKEVNIDRLQRSIEKATRAGREDMVAALNLKMQDAMTRQTPGEVARAIQQEIVSNLGKLEAIIGILPKEARGLIGGYPELAAKRTPKERLDFLAQRINKVDKVFEKHLRSFYGDQIQNILKPPKITSGVPRSKIGVEAQREVDAIRTISEMSADQTTARMREIEEEARRDGEDAPAPERLAAILDEWNILNRWGDLENRTASELAQNYTDIKEIAKSGRESTKIIEEMRRADVLAKIEEVKAGTEAPTDEQLNNWSMLSDGEQWVELGKGLQFSHKNFLQILSKILPENTSFLQQWSDDIRHADNGTIDKVIDVQRQMQAAIYPILVNMGFMERYAAQRDLRAKVKGKIHIISGRKTEKVTMKIEEARRIINEVLDKGKYSDADVETMREELAALSEDYRKKNISFERVVSEGKRTTTPLTKEQMIQAILGWGDSNVRGHMEKTGYTEESIREMHAVLEGNELAQALLAFNREFYVGDYDQWNPTYREQFNMDMPKHAGYTPGRYYNSGGPDANIGLSPFGGPIETTGALPGPVKSRVNHSARYRPTDATQTLWEHAYQRAHWTSFAKINREMRGVFGNKEIQERLHAKLGPKGLNAVNNWLDVLANAGTQKAIEVGFMNDLINRIIGGKVISALSWSLKTVVNQTDSLTRFTYAMTGPEVAATLPKNPAQHVPMIWNTPTIQRRVIGGANPAVRHFFQRSQTNPSMLIDLGKLGLVPMQGYDAWLTSHSAAMVYTFELGKALEAGLPQNQAHEKAMDRMDEAVYRYSQPMGVANKSLMEVSGNNYFKLWMMFQSDPALKSRLITEAYGDMGRAMKAGDNVKASRSAQRIAAVYAGHFLSTMVIASYRDIFTDEASEDIWSPLGIIAGTMLGPFTGYFLVGTIATGAISKLSGTPTYDRSPNPLDQWWSHAGYVFTHFEDLFGNEDDGDKVISAWNHLAQATAVFGPASALPSVGMKIIKTVAGAGKEEKEPRNSD